MEKLDFKDLEGFAFFLQKISRTLSDKISSRGWAYILEQKRYINKDQFDMVTNVMNKCRKKGYLRQFGLCRICFREMANKGLIPGIKKSSW